MKSKIQNKAIKPATAKKVVKPAAKLPAKGGKKGKC